MLYKENKSKPKKKIELSKGEFYDREVVFTLIVDSLITKLSDHFELEPDEILDISLQYFDALKELIEN